MSRAGPARAGGWALERERALHTDSILCAVDFIEENAILHGNLASDARPRHILHGADNDTDPGAQTMFADLVQRCQSG